MNSNLWRIVGTVVLFILIFLTGFLLTRSGKPYNGALFSVHKLITLAAVVFLVVMVIQVNKAIGLGTTALAAVIVTGLLFLVTIISGGLVSALKTAPTVVLLIHRIAPFLTAISTAATLFLTLGRAPVF